MKDTSAKANAISSMPGTNSNPIIKQASNFLSGSLSITSFYMCIITKGVRKWYKKLRYLKQSM